MGQAQRLATFDSSSTPKSFALYDGEWKETGKFIQILDPSVYVCKRHTWEHK